MDIVSLSSTGIQRVHVKDPLPSESLDDWAALDRDAKLETEKCMEPPSSTDPSRWQERITSVPRTIRVRQHLQLPPFRSLGLASPYTKFLLTPPDEAEITKWNASCRDPLQIPTSTSVQRPSSVASEGTTPETPHVHEFIPGNVINSPTPEGTMAEGGSGHDNSSSDSDNSRSAWIEEAVKIATSAIPVNDLHSHVLNVFCHSQPCPLSDEAASTSPAYVSIVSALQAKFASAAQGRYIEVTHAVPVKFSMAHLPTSPVTTPIVTSSETGELDYFNMTVFAKAVVAVDHHDPGQSDIPCSPHPIVAPSSVGISLLERFIPPAEANEYTNLFTSRSPSVLVDRLVELSPDNGTLIFIYPTVHGAATFASRYLGPLLDPLLRTMAGIHELSADMGAKVGEMTVVEGMYSYETMARKIDILLKSFSNGILPVGPPPKYTLVYRSKQLVQLEREAWTEWWTHQQTPHIKIIMNKYFQQAKRLPPSKEITAGSLVREILNGVGNRAYSKYDKPREGVEVGVFVIQRTAGWNAIRKRGQEETNRIRPIWTVNV